MKPNETVDNIRRIREIYRRQSVPRVTVMVDYAMVHRGKRAERIFAKLRRGFMLRNLR